MSNALFPYHLTDNTLTVFVAGRPKAVPRTNEAVVREVMSALTNPSTTIPEMLALMDPRQAANLVVSKLPGVEIKRVGGAEVLHVGGKPVHGALGKRVLDVLAVGLDPAPWFLFVEKCFQNPYRDAITEFYPLFEKSGMPITASGNVLMYKRVNREYMSNHSGRKGRVSYKIGELVEMDEPEIASVDTGRAMCSTGLHFAPYQYLHGFSGEVTLLVEIDPRDIINIDASQFKGRAIRMRVVDEVSNDSKVLELKKWEPVVDVLTNVNELEPHEEALEALVQETTPDKARTPAKRTPKAAKPIRRATATKAGSAPKTAVVVVETKWAGRLTKIGFRKLVAEHGSLAGVAKHFGISQGTVQGAKKKLEL